MKQGDPLQRGSDWHSGKKLTVKSCYSIPFPWNVQTRQMQSVANLLSDCCRSGEAELGLDAREHRIPAGKDENVWNWTVGMFAQLCGYIYELYIYV